MKANVIKELCIGCSLCIGICPTVFEFDQGVAVVKLDPVPLIEQASSKEAMESCPVGAITLE